MLMTLLVIFAVWFFGSIPLALVVGRMLGAKDRMAEALEPTSPAYEAPALTDLSA